MSAWLMDDPISRENLRADLVRRLISHGLRTTPIERLTGLSRNRQATMRRRLNVPDKSRLRGPTKTSLELFLKTARRRSEGAALVSMCTLFEIPITVEGLAIPKTVSLPFTDRLCETYEAYCACFPQTELELEDLILLRRSIVSGEIRVGRCRVCKGLILINPYDGDSRTCAQCAKEG